MKAWFLLKIILCLVVVAPGRAEGASKPNIIFILADDLGYGDLGSYGQKKIKTPELDRLAAEGMRFTSVYAGSTVCAPSRCALMTGMHMGHARMRGNSRDPILPEDETVAEVLKKGGYRTALIGKWGLGEQKTTGSPSVQGFDYYFGYLNQKHAHDYYPTNLWRNDELVPLPENAREQRKTYSHDLFAEEGLKWVRENKEGPFFLFWAFTIPHANNERKAEGMEVPDDEPYSDEPWPQPEKNKAAMITRMDADIGKMIRLLKELGIADRTLVVFSSDNGPHREGGNDPEFFQSAGPLRGIKRDLYEGGIRVPGIVWWPGNVKAGEVSDYPWAFWDFLPTAAALAKVPCPEKVDGISIVPLLLGKEQPDHGPFYWEFHEGGCKVAGRMGNWKAVRVHPQEEIELYDLRVDMGERNNVSREHPDVVARFAEFFRTARVESEKWPIKFKPLDNLK